MVTDLEYPAKTAFSALGRLTDEFSSKFPNKQQWNSPNYPELKQHLVNFQNPNNSDPMLRVQRELDETKIVLVNFLI
jgi:synaptobrevin family protein YKT6